MVYSYVTIEVTSRCNFKCKMCGRQGRWKIKPADMSLEDLQEIVGEIRSTSPDSFVQLVGNGEPFLHPQIRLLLEQPIDIGLNTVTTTNASLPLTNLPDLRFLAVSIDATTKQLYEKIREGGDWERLMKNLTEFRLECPNMPLQFNSVFMKCNMENLKQMPKLLQQYKVGRWFIQAVKPLTAWAREQAVPQYLCTAWKYNTNQMLEKIGDKCRTSFRGMYHPGHCNQSGQYGKEGFTGSPYIDVEGNVMPCCTIANPLYSLGNVFTDGTLKEIWYGEKAEWWRKQMLSIHPPLICNELCGQII